MRLKLDNGWNPVVITYASYGWWPDSCCCCLVVKSCLTLHDPMDQSTPDPPVSHCLPELGQIHVGSFDDTFYPSRHLLSPLPLAFTLYQHQSLFQGVFSSHEMAKVLEPSASGSVLPVSTQGWFLSKQIGLFSLQSRGLSRASSSTTIQRHQFLSLIHIPSPRD